jgi:signal transduction histidine kinase
VSAAEKSPEGRIGIDDPVDIDRLLLPEELAELAARFAEAHGCAVAVEDARGRRLAHAGQGEGAPSRCEVRHGGEALGAVVATGPGAERTARLVSDVLGLLLHHAHARALTNATHEAAMEQSFADLTAQNTRLEQAVQRLTEVDRLKSTFLATMSHELRTPLTSVIGYSEMLLEGLAGALAAEQRDYVTTILSKADQLLQMITSVLDVSMLEAGRVQMDEQQQVPLAEVVDSVVASFVPQAGKRGIAITVDTSAQLVAKGDRRKIRQVLWNLVSNAVKFSRDQGTVGVALKEGPLRPADPTAPKGVLVEITDSGIGISRHQLASIFEPFFQVDQSSTREYGGSGLGLTLAKAYVEAHGGRIWVDSNLGTGSTFTVSFPIAVSGVGGRVAE